MIEMFEYYRQQMERKESKAVFYSRIEGVVHRQKNAVDAHPVLILENGSEVQVTWDFIGDRDVTKMNYAVLEDGEEMLYNEKDVKYG